MDEDRAHYQAQSHMSSVCSLEGRVAWEGNRIPSEEREK